MRTRMKLHNTLGHQTVDFEPINPAEVKLYSCGPTLYNHVHIGNLVSFIMADTLRRALSLNGYQVKHVMNFTDVDDKTIKRSREPEFAAASPMESLQKLTHHFEKVFLADIEAIGIDTGAIQFVRATDYVQQMQELIRQLYDRDIAYVGEDGVYFSLSEYRKHHDYGVLSSIPNTGHTQARINNDEYDKDSAHDFALWKKQAANEPAWEFKLGEEDLSGRPGWHIECSVMSTEMLGQPFDIHTGGIDLVFPHHENEIAQSQGAGDKPYANFFVHNEHLLVEGRKMAKSADNFFTLADIIERGHDPLALRLLTLQSHYSHQLNFSWSSLQSAENFLQQLRDFADLRFQTSPGDDGLNIQKLADTQAVIRERLSNNLDTAGALAMLAGVIGESAARTRPATKDLDAFEKFLLWIDESFGLRLSDRQDITPAQKELITERENARANKDFDAADKLRGRLAEDGLVIDDTADGPLWSRQSNLK